MNHNIPGKRALLSLLLTAALCQLPSCGFIVFNDPDAETAPVTTAAPETEAPETTAAETTAAPETEAPVSGGELARLRLDALPNRNFMEAPVIVATVDNVTVCPMEADDAAGAVRVDSRRAVEEKFNTTIIASKTDAASMLADVKTAINSGMYYADLMAIPLSSVGSFWASGALGNLYTLPYASYDADYYHADIIEAAHAGEALYAASGAANYNPDHISCVYFNRTLAKEAGIGDLYQLVRDGNWTWDKLREYSMSAQRSINGITGLGSYADNAAFIDLAATAHDIEYTSSSNGAVPAVNYLDRAGMSDRVKAVVDTMYRILYQDSAILKNTGSTVRSAFSGGTLLFSVDRLSLIPDISDGKTEWGILPLPKYDASQSEYLSPLPGDSPVFCIPANVTSVENPGLILEGLNIAADGYVTDTWLSERINYHLRDSASIDMLDIILADVTADFAHLWASGFAHLENATTKAVYNGITTRSTIETLYKNYAAAANRDIAAKIKLSEYE